MKNIITISREFGSGGRTIAKAAAQRLGYAFYDKELIEKIAEESGLSREYIEAHGEHAPGRTYFGYAFVGRDTAGNSVGDYLWKVQRDIIEDLAEKGNCVIVGRCADYALEEYDNVIRLFIHADMDARIRRIARIYDLTDSKAKELIVKTDKKRASYYNYYSNKKWGSAESFDVCLDSSVLGIDGTVETILQLVELKEKAGSRKIAI